MREFIAVACTECKDRNYTFFKNKKLKPDKLEIKKFCRGCKKHTLHKEIK